MHKILAPIILTAVFVLGFFYAKDGLAKFYEGLLKGIKSSTTFIFQKEDCGEKCREIVKEEVGKAVSLLSKSTERPKAAETATASSKGQVSYIPLDGTYSTTSTSWIDVPGAEVSFDLAADYGKNAKAAWEASLKVANANGTAYARIFDSTHGIAVDGSEISLANKDAYQRVSSGNLNLWSGRNVYKVQIKSLNSFEVWASGGKMRISY